MWTCCVVPPTPMIPHEQAFFVCDSYLVTTTGPYWLLTAQGKLCAQKEPSVSVGVKKNNLFHCLLLWVFTSAFCFHDSDGLCETGLCTTLTAHNPVTEIHNIKIWTDTRPSRHSRPARDKGDGHGDGADREQCVSMFVRSPRMPQMPAVSLLSSQQLHGPSQSFASMCLNK